MMPNANVTGGVGAYCVSVLATLIPKFATFIRELANGAVIGMAAPNGAGRRCVGVDIRIPLAGLLGWRVPNVSRWMEIEQQSY